MLMMMFVCRVKWRVWSVIAVRWDHSASVTGTQWAAVSVTASAWAAHVLKLQDSYEWEWVYTHTSQTHTRTHTPHWHTHMDTRTHRHTHIISFSQVYKVSPRTVNLTFFLENQNSCVSRSIFSLLHPWRGMLSKGFDCLSFQPVVFGECQCFLRMWCVNRGDGISPQVTLDVCVDALLNHPHFRWAEMLRYPGNSKY